MIRDALVVGINIYQDDTLRNLKAPASDAEEIAKMLKLYGEFEVWRLPEAIDPETKKPYISKTRELSLTQLKEALVKLFKPEGRQVPDTALFYFSGHGIREDKGIQEGFLATSDVCPQLGFNGLSLQWLRRLFQESPVRQQIIWLDCCHSGEILNFDEANPGTKGQARDRSFIASSREFEPSLEDLETRYSVLTKYLLSGLDPNRCPKKWVTTISLTDFINENLRNENQRPVPYNFGEPIKLTRTWDVETPDSKGQDSKDICPYKGLEYFDCNDEDPKYFYGREELTDDLLDWVRQSNFLAILGASGSGKSSVLRAGLLHQLNKGRKLPDSQNWKIKIVLPGEHPLEKLALCWLSRDLSNAKRATELDQIESLLKQGGEGLRKLVQASTASRVILVVDQFEEVFTLCKDLVEREKFFECLLVGVEKAKGKLCLILAMRADFFGKCLEREYSGLGKKIEENLVSVPTMKREELRKAIAEPAQQVDLTIEKVLIERMLKDIEGSPGSLPLLEYTLTRLWQEKTDNQLQLSTYERLGGIEGTLDRRATDVYQKFSPVEQQIAKQIFLCLTQLGEGTEDTRRRVLKPELMTEKYPQSDLEEVIQLLADEKLIVTDEQADKGDVAQRVVVIDVAHEALIRHWQQLRRWLDENRDALRKQREIEEDAQIWVDHDKPLTQGFLWVGYKLAEAEKVLQEYAATVTLSTLSQEFLEECRKQELRSYLLDPASDNLDQIELEKETAAKSFLTKPRLWYLLKDESEEAKVRLGASWGLKQWGEEVPMWLAEIEEEEKISLREVEPPRTVVEDLGNGISLELVEIPGGEFWMGAPEEEEESNWWERPQHKVKVSPFLMGKYPVTQSQWRDLASLPEVERSLDLDPSYFKGDDQPVEQVSWDDAVEFCKRLSRKTGRDYRLPSEAEWEYACRAGTTTPYHFGKTIAPDLANYAQAGRGGTTPVGRFQVANAFGLYDMHGQVFEWCEDDWHDDYEGAPTDGSAWIRKGGLWGWSKGARNIKVLRGGSWYNLPVNCRSAFRGDSSRDDRFDLIGFRVVRVAPRTT